MGYTKPISRNLRLDEALDGVLRDFCVKTNRHEPHTIRAVLTLFFADGFETAERRLTTGLWEPSKSEPTSEDEARADYIVGSKRRKPKRSNTA